MWYLFGQVWLLLLIAFVLGWITHWFFCCRKDDDELHDSSFKPSNISDTARPVVTETKVATAAPVVPDAAPAAPIVKDEWKPQGFVNQPDKVDDLKRIKGIGAVIEKTLNELGIYQFDQISSWDADNVSWVENFIAFPGRINREDWINQAKTLGAGGTTDFAKRVDQGELDY